MFDVFNRVIGFIAVLSSFNTAFSPDCNKILGGEAHTCVYHSPDATFHMENSLVVWQRLSYIWRSGQYPSAALDEYFCEHACFSPGSVILEIVVVSIVVLLGMIAIAAVVWFIIRTAFSYTFWLLRMVLYNFGLVVLVVLVSYLAYLASFDPIIMFKSVWTFRI